MADITYIRVGDYYVPDLALPKRETYSLGKYGRMREHHLKEKHPVLYNVLMLSGKLQFICERLTKPPANAWR